MRTLFYKASEYFEEPDQFFYLDQLKNYLLVIIISEIMKRHVMPNPPIKR